MPDVSDVRIPPERFDSPLSPVDLFPQAGPIEVEIGCGKGGFLLRRARAHPERNFLGLEWANKYATFAAERMVRWRVDNVRVVRIDARPVFQHALPDECLDALHAFHPDPWPKRRHAKRRLFQIEFVRAAIRTLRPGAHWAVQTDHAPYFEQIRDLLTSQPELVEVPFDAQHNDLVDGRVDTNFEVKYRRQGRAIFRLAVQKQSRSC